MILIKMNLLCNFSCTYCYQHPIRPEEQEIDYDAVEATVRQLYQEQLSSRLRNRNLKPGELKPEERPQIVLHGGEPLFQDKQIIKRFLKLSFELSGKSSIQTNGFLIDPDLIEIFKEYKTGIGISIDGPWPCNELRGKGSKKERRKQTEKILANIDELLEAGLTPGVIIVLHKKNALGDRREILKHWVKELYGKKITGRLNPCCSGNPKIDLTAEELADFYEDMFNFMLRNGIAGWSPFRDMATSLRGKSRVECKFRSCDPYCTRSAISVLRDGSQGVCLRLYGDGKIYLRHDKASNIRDKVLLQSDCANCEWWEHCYGGCSGTARDFDWRNKDRFCLAWKTLYPKVANALKVLGIPRTEKPAPQITRHPGGDHTDGVEHTDGDWRHLDSEIGRPSQLDHTDGIEHLDGAWRHIDSNTGD